MDSSSADFKQMFYKITALAPEIFGASMENSTYGKHAELLSAYETLMSVTMRIQHAETRSKALRPKVQLGIQEFFSGPVEKNTNLSFFDFQCKLIHVIILIKCKLKLVR